MNGSNISMNVQRVEELCETIKKHQEYLYKLKDNIRGDIKYIHDQVFGIGCSSQMDEVNEEIEITVERLRRMLHSILSAAGKIEDFSKYIVKEEDVIFHPPGWYTAQTEMQKAIERAGGRTNIEVDRNPNLVSSVLPGTIAMGKEILKNVENNTPSNTNNTTNGNGTNSGLPGGATTSTPYMDRMRQETLKDVQNNPPSNTNNTTNGSGTNRILPGGATTSTPYMDRMRQEIFKDVQSNPPSNNNTTNGGGNGGSRGTGRSTGGSSGGSTGGSTSGGVTTQNWVSSEETPIVETTNNTSTVETPTGDNNSSNSNTEPVPTPTGEVEITTGTEQTVQTTPSSNNETTSWSSEETSYSSENYSTENVENHEVSAETKSEEVVIPQETIENENNYEKGNSYSKIPVSTISKVVSSTATKKSGGNSVIPVLAGISAAAAAGIGAKAYLDRKKNRDNDSEIETEDWKENEESIDDIETDTTQNDSSYSATIRNEFLEE